MSGGVVMMAWEKGLWTVSITFMKKDFYERVGDLFLLEAGIGSLLWWIVLSNVWRCFDYEPCPSRPCTVNTDFYERVSLKGNTNTIILSTVGYALFPLPSDGLRGRIMNGVHHVPEHGLLWACTTEGKYLYSNSLFVLLLLLMSYMGFILILVFYMIYEGMRESSPRGLNMD